MATRKFLRRKNKAKAENKPAQTFFQQDNAINESAEGSSWFFPPEAVVQTKLKVSEPGDPEEKEADRMADRVVNPKQEEDEVSKKEDEEEKVAKKEEEDEPERLSRKKQAQSTGKSPVSSQALGESKGTYLPNSTNREMSSSFGFDFSNVRIHTDDRAREMSEQLGAHAFTYKGEIYFNREKFQPGNEAGKWLLAHELAHVVQQNGWKMEKINRKEVAGITTPVPGKFKVKKDKEVVKSAEGRINGVKVIILPDIQGDVKPGLSADTSIDLKYELPGMKYDASGIVTEITGIAVVKIIIRTTYLPGVSPASPSGYGRGTTKPDKDSGKTSLKFHEGNHGLEAMAYLKNHQVPPFEGKVGMTVKDFDKAKADFIRKVTDYRAQLIKANKAAVDCVGKPASFCKP